MSTAQILPTLWRRRFTFIVTFVAVMVVVELITFTSPKVYSTVTYLIVSQSRAPSSTFEATQVNEVLTRTYSELLQTRPVAEEVARALPFRMTVDELLGAVVVRAVSQSQLLSITAEGRTPTSAQTIANVYATTFVGQARRLSVASGNNAAISIAQPAALVKNPTRPKPLLYMAVGAVLAALLAAGLALLRQRLDQRLEIDASTSDIFGVPVIGYVPQRTGRRDGPSSRQADEAFRLVLVNLAFANRGTRPASLAVVSSGEREGKSTTSLGLARAAAELGSSVLLVDGDLRRPTLAADAERAGANVSASPGLGFHLASGGGVAWDTLVCTVPETSLSIVPSSHVPNPTALLSSRVFEDFMARVERAYDLVIVDTPPLTIGPDASLVAALTAGAVFVIDASKTKRTPANRAIEQLRRTETMILGIVLNRTVDASSSSYYYAGPTFDAGRGRAPQASEAETAPPGTPGGR